MATVRAEQQAKDKEAQQASARALHARSGTTADGGGNGDFQDSDEEDEDSKEPIYDMFLDELFVHFGNGSIFLNETEVPKRAHIMSRNAELLYKRKELARERGLDPHDVSLSELSELDREEEEAEHQRIAERQEQFKKQEEEVWRQRQRESRQRELALLDGPRSRSEDDSGGTGW